VEEQRDGERLAGERIGRREVHGPAGCRKRAVDEQWLAYWLGQPVAARLAGAMRCRRRVQGRLPRLDRSSFRVIDLAELTD
jgi:hypothetical protein